MFLWEFGLPTPPKTGVLQLDSRLTKNLKLQCRNNYFRSVAGQFLTIFEEENYSEVITKITRIMMRRMTGGHLVSNYYYEA